MPLSAARARPAEAAPPQDGVLELPKGKIAAIATYLEMFAAPAGTTAAPDGRFEPIGRDLARYRDLYRTVGEPWLWFSRARMSDRDLAAILTSEDVAALAFRVDGADIGMVELDFRRGRECELCFLGLVEGAIGAGWGRVLMDEAIRRAFSRPIERLWLHTCTLDHPDAVGFYMGAGFVPFRRAVEIADDPRLTGHLRPEAAPALPIV